MDGLRKRCTTLAGASIEALGALARSAHLPSRFCRAGSLGTQPILRAKTLMARLMVQLQRSALSSMLSGILVWQRQAPEGHERFVVLGVSHQWDDSPQMLREAQPVRSAKAARQRTGKNVLVQRSVVQMTAAELQPDGVCRLWSRAENFIVPPLLLHGKSAEWLRGAMLRSSSWRGPLDVEDQTSMQSLCDFCQAAVTTLWPDGGSPNGRWIRHLIALSERHD